MPSIGATGSPAARNDQSIKDRQSTWVQSAPARSDYAPACGIRLAGIAEGTDPAPLPRADGTIFAGAELRLASSTSRCPALAFTDHMEAGRAGEAGIREGAPLVPATGADRLEFPCTQGRTGPWSRSRWRTDGSGLHDAGGKENEARKQRGKPPQQSSITHSNPPLSLGINHHERSAQSKSEDTL